MPGLEHIRNQHECISIFQIKGMTHLLLLGLLAPNLSLYSSTAMPNTRPVVHTMLTIIFKISHINLEELIEKLTYPIRLSGYSE